MASSRKKTPQSDLVARVESFLIRQLEPARPARLCVGLSGGLDSIVLLHLAAACREKIACELSAIHVHHGLSPNADDWAEFACRSAAALGIECRVERVRVERRTELGLEAAARHARYAVFESQDCDALLLAQHRDDQAETLLLNLLRGGGVRGLAAMPPSRRLASGARLLRPLLDVSREEILAWARQNRLDWIDDESNLDQTIARNCLRHTVLPFLDNLYPGAAAQLARSAGHLAESAQILGEIGEADLQACLVDRAFDLDRAAGLSEARWRNALRVWLARAGINPDARAFNELLRMMRDARGDAEPCWAWRDQAVRRYRGRLCLGPARIVAGPEISVQWCEGRNIGVPQWHGELIWQRTDAPGIGERYLSGAVLLRPRNGGESIRRVPDGPHRVLKHLWQEAGIPPWVRESTPLLWIDGKLAAVPGLCIAAEFLEPGGWQVAWRAAPADVVFK